MKNATITYDDDATSRFDVHYLDNRASAGRTWPVERCAAFWARSAGAALAAFAAWAADAGFKAGIDFEPLWIHSWAESL